MIQLAFGMSLLITFRSWQRLLGQRISSLSVLVVPVSGGSNGSSGSSSSSSSNSSSSSSSSSPPPLGTTLYSKWNIMGKGCGGGGVVPC